ncbi:hypothetical protein [Plantactinospora sp. KLBMP9567]|uniref:hypothetical protein n=1 Tax=Plantactinospora sp. KLBMP9567 TaxID=3085900 RepID=UPI002980FC6C|nr:hypothetical protein [Plantactinospora sp. KLBMP9567]MDW5323329.1 hypothetical protein [Plantactinospora sp. KLBMP9567]
MSDGAVGPTLMGMDRSLIKLSGVAALTALAVLAVSTASAGSTTTAASTGSAGWRGTVVSVSDTPVLSMKQEQVEEFLEPLGVYVPQARHGVDAYQIVYRTVDVRGRATTASSLAALPRTNDRRLRLAVWLHGTQSYRLDAPSVSECCDRAAVVLFASLGYAATAPDYLGLGAGPGTHPYFHAETAVSASVDALRAARHFAAR